MNNTNFKKNAILNILGTTINAFNSLFLMIIVMRINGINEAGLFTFAFALATSFNIIGVYAGRIYQVTNNNQINDKEFIVNRIVSCLIMIIISVIFVLIKGYDLFKCCTILILCILKMLEAFSDVIYGLFQKSGNLYKVGISLIIKNLFGLFLFIIIDKFTGNLLLSIVCFTVVYILTMIFYDKNNVSLKEIRGQNARIYNVIKIFKDGFYTFAISFLTIFIINSSKYAIDALMDNDVQAIFSILIMPATIMILIAQFIIHPFLIIMKEKIYNFEYNSLHKLIFRICIIIIMFGIIGVISGYYIGIPLLEIVYGINLKQYSMCLSIILIGATFYAITSVINTILIAMRYTFIQMIFYLFIGFLSYFLSYHLVNKFEIFGASLAYLIIMFISLITFLIIYIFISRKEIKYGKRKSNSYIRSSSV